MPPNYERRATERPVEYRAASDDASGLGVLTGYGAVFNSESRDLGGFVEVILPGAFGEPIDETGALDVNHHVRVMARTNHDNAYLLGTTDAGTLRLFVDDIGLWYEIDLPDTSYGRDLAVLAKRGDIRFSSFAFHTPPGGDRWDYNANDQIVRYVTAAKLVDVAPVADPAYWDSTSLLVRSFDLDAIRASLTPPGEPASNERAAIAGRANLIQITIEGSHHDGY